MNKHNKIDLVELPASSPEDLKAAQKFYSEVFEWKFKEWGPEYSDTQDSGVAAGINAVGEMKQKMPLAVIFSEDIDKSLVDVENAGGEIIHPITPFPGGKRFHFKDPAGNELAVWAE